MQVQLSFESNTAIGQEACGNARSQYLDKLHGSYWRWRQVTTV